MLDIMKMPNWRNQLTSSVSYVDAEIFYNADNGDRHYVSEFLSNTQLYMTSKRQLLNEYGAYLDKNIEEARKPYLLRKDLPYPPEIMTVHLFPVFQKAGDDDGIVVANDTENALLLTACALQAYHAEHGSYPASLTALVPDELTHLPADPFAPGAALCYKPKGDKYLLYSIGPDGKDDGGLPIFTGPPDDPARYGMNDFSNRVGDIVAGINLYVYSD